MNFSILEKKLLSKRGAYLDYPFGPEAAVFKVAKKMFALVAWQDDPLRITLKCDPEDALQYRAMFTAVKPGYHMNKQHWNTITLNDALDDALDDTIDGTVPDEVIDEMIEASYALVVKGLRKADRVKLEAARGGNVESGRLSEKF